MNSKPLRIQIHNPDLIKLIVEKAAMKKLSPTQYLINLVNGDTKDDSIPFPR